MSSKNGFFFCVACLQYTNVFFFRDVEEKVQKKKQEKLN